MRWIFALCIGGEQALRVSRSTQLKRQCARCRRVSRSLSAVSAREAEGSNVTVTICVRSRPIHSRRVWQRLHSLPTRWGEKQEVQAERLEMEEPSLTRGIHLVPCSQTENRPGHLGRSSLILLQALPSRSLREARLACGAKSVSVDHCRHDHRDQYGPARQPPLVVHRRVHDAPVQQAGGSPRWADPHRQ